ncbi:MAG TPA: pentapeptide repeat-containing protein [Arsenophonus nasoniae]|uniref:pentapeptide repeat-containing protein n=1 Tax=Arsenophonus nasoniae TaxID=638 RepID=UPI00387A4C09
MTIINHAFTSPIWMTSTLDNKKEIEMKLNQANAAGYPVHLIDNEQEEKGKSLTWWPNNNDSAIFNNQSFDNQKINLSITINEFYNIAHDEQNRLLRLLLIKEGIINHDKKAIPAGELVNHVINYVARCKNDNSKISELARLLLKPLGQYGSGQNEQITAIHSQTVIANWLQQAVFNTSADSWLLKKICDIKLQQHSLFHHDNLKQGVFNQLNSHIEVNQLSANVGDYYQQQVLSHIMPTLFLQPKNSYDQQRLQNMVINQPEWGYLHAGTALLSESGADFNSMSLDQIINIGMWLETMLLEEKLPVEYIQYFKLPALIHSVLKNNYQQITHEIDKAKMFSIYHIYFDHLTEHSKNNPFVQWVQRVNNWKSRPELARQQLIEHNVEQTWLNNYLYKNSDVKYHDRQGNAVVLPNIDKVFNNQNQQLADIFKQTELTLLPQVFNAFSEAEQQFIQQAQIYLVKAEFNAQGSVRSAPLPPPARLGMVASGALITRVPDSIDMLKCIFNGEERIYALQKQANTEIGRYQLYRVDYDKKAILDLFPHDHKIRDDDDYQLRLHVDSLLKQADEKPQVLLSSLSTLHRNRLAEKLQQEGYQPTIQQKVDTFFLHLIPFYTTITEVRKGNTGQAVGAALFDVSGFFPFLAKAAHISNRFSIAVGEAAVNGLQTALKQATLRQALHQGAKQLLKSGIPHVTNSLPANLFAELGTAFLRSADPGFELLASGGLKGIHALKKVAKQSQQQLSGLTQLVEALEKKANDFPVAHSERFKIETAYHPAQLKEVPVTKIGRQSGKDIYVQVYPETGQPFGRKYLRDTAGNLALAPVPIGERLYQLKIQGLGGKGAKMGAKKLAAQSNTVQLEQISLNELKELLLIQQENTIIDLSSKNLHNIDFSTLFAEKIDLTFVNFSDANLSGSNLSNLNLTNATLHKASLNGAILHRVNLNNANLISVDLYRAILNDAKLNNANLLRANLKETNLVNADLINADLTQATLSHTNLMHANLAHADLTQTDLSYANLQQVSIHGTNFSGAILDNTIDNFTLSLPSKWNEHNLEFELNHFNPQGRSILTSIDSIDDKCSQLKTKLALQVIHSLEHSTVNLTNVTPSLLDIFSKALFIKNPEINNFVDKLIENYLKKPSLQLINKLEAHPTMIPAFLNYFDRQPYLMELAKYNDAFIQTLIATRTQGADSIKITANSLYKKYLHLPYIQQQLQHAEIKRLFDDQAGNGDWTKKRLLIICYCRQQKQEEY